MPIDRLVVIGASAGGIDAFRTLLGALPTDFSAAVCIVLHTSTHSPGVLDRILARTSTLPVTIAESGERLRAGHVYVARPDYHLLVEPGVLRLARGPKEHRFRPAIDPLFRSAAQVYGPAVVGVILTGHLDDGTAGLQAIKALGGVALVQTPSDAMVPSMPESAIRHVAVDHVVPLDRMAPLLTDVVSTRVHETQVRIPDDVRVEVEIARERSPLDAGLTSIARPSIFTCPECSGVLLELTGKRYRCHTGHAYSAESLAASLQDAIEDALWNALRSIEEEQLLLERSEDPGTASQRDARIAADRRDAAALRTIIASRVQLATAAG